jgi:hypothetical protein
MLTEFSKLGECSILLAYCATVLKNGDDRELMYCLAFVDNFVYNSVERQRVVYNDTTLRGALYGYLEDALPSHLATRNFEQFAR